VVGRVAGEEHGRCGGDHRGRCLVGLRAGEEHERLDDHADASAPCESGVDQELRLLVRVGGRQHHDAVDTRVGEHPPVEVVVGRERPATLEHHHTGHRGDRRAAPSERRHRRPGGFGLRWLPAGN
jgi:hypothetical protein